MRRRRLNEGTKAIIGISGSEKQSAEELSRFLTIMKKGKRDIAIYDGYILDII